MTPAVLLIVLATAFGQVGTPPQSETQLDSVLIGGWATWCAETPRHCTGWDTRYVGAVPSFRHGDKPYRVRVCLADGSRCTTVTVVSYCACGDRHGVATIIDLSPPAFRELAPLSRGVIRVELTNANAVRLPETDTEGAP